MPPAHYAPEAGVEAGLGAMQRQQEAVLLCPASQLCGGTLVPDPPNAADARNGVAAPDYAEVRVQLLDFTQVGGGAQQLAQRLECCAGCSAEA